MTTPAVTVLPHVKQRSAYVEMGRRMQVCEICGDPAKYEALVEYDPPILIDPAAGLRLRTALIFRCEDHKET